MRQNNTQPPFVQYSPLLVDVALQNKVLDATPSSVERSICWEILKYICLKRQNKKLPAFLFIVPFHCIFKYSFFMSTHNTQKVLKIYYF